VNVHVKHMENRNIAHHKQEVLGVNVHVKHMENRNIAHHKIGEIAGVPHK
jgi:hypothetical protein